MNNNLKRKFLSVLVAGCAGAVQAAPTQPQVVSGQATFLQLGDVFTITNTPNAIINWQSFSVNPGETTRFVQQSADSVVLNRITGEHPSQILGALQSNGHVFLINPNGILFGQGARIDVNGLTASTLALSDADFLAGRRNFSAGTEPANIANNGSITTPDGGKVFLVAANVENNGIITAPNGEVVLAAGHSVQLVDSANPDLRVVVSSPAGEVVNLGQVVAQGGKIGIYGALVRQRGVVNADSAVRGADGLITLVAGALSGGDAVMPGSIAVRADSLDINGGLDAGPNGHVTIAPQSAETRMVLGGLEEDGAGRLALTNAELAGIKSGSLTLGGNDGQRGGITVGGVASFANAGRVTLDAGEGNLAINAPLNATTLLTLRSLNQIVQGADGIITAPMLDVRGSLVDLSQANAVGLISGSASEGLFQFGASGDLHVGVAGDSLDSSTGVRSNAGAIRLTSTGGMVIDGTVHSAGGDISLEAGPDALLNIRPRGAVINGSGDISLKGKQVINDGTVEAARGRVIIDPKPKPVTPADPPVPADPGPPANPGPPADPGPPANPGPPADKPNPPEKPAVPEVPPVTPPLPPVTPPLPPVLPVEPPVPAPEPPAPVLTLDQCVAAPGTPGCSSVLPSLGACTVAPSTQGCAVVLPTLAQCAVSPGLQGCSAVLPAPDACTLNPSLAACAVVSQAPAAKPGESPLASALQQQTDLNPTADAIQARPAESEPAKKDQTIILADAASPSGAKDESPHKTKTYCN